MIDALAILTAGTWHRLQNLYPPKPLFHERALLHDFRYNMQSVTAVPKRDTCHRMSHNGSLSTRTLQAASDDRTITRHYRRNLVQIAESALAKPIFHERPLLHDFHYNIRSVTGALNRNTCHGTTHNDSLSTRTLQAASDGRTFQHPYRRNP